MRFLGKINPFSSRFRTELVDLSKTVDDLVFDRDHILDMATRELPSVPDIMLVKIVGARSINGNDGDVASGSPSGSDASKNVWIYQWESVTKSDVDSDGYTFFAVNGAELDNTNSDEQQSYGVTTSSVDTLVELLPIGDNERQPVVLLYRVAAPVNYTFTVYNGGGSATGSVTIPCQHFFSAGNDVEVTCPA